MNGGTVERAWLVGRLTGALKIQESAAEETVDELTALKLLAEPASGRVSLTERGREVFEEMRTGGHAIAAQLYAGIPAEDLATADRVLTLVTVPGPSRVTPPWAPSAGPAGRPD